MNGWTHRRKGKRNDPYLKIKVQARIGSDEGAIFVDMDQKFRYVPWTEVIEL